MQLKEHASRYRYTGVVNRMTMTVTAFVMYGLANIALFVLFWLYQKKPTQPNNTPDRSQTRVSKRRNKIQRPSLLAILGFSSNDHHNVFYAIEDHFHNFMEVSDACKRAGLEKCGLIIGIDFTASNELQGRKTFSGQCLHKTIPGKIYNPYQKVISIIGQTLEPFDDDNFIPSYGFGDSQTGGNSVFPFHPEDKPCQGFSEVLDRYSFLASNVILSGPTNFAPLIHKAIEIVKLRHAYHILIIVADGQVTEEDETIEAIMQASKYALSIVVVGVGDGPWDLMEEFDDHLPKRQFDNFQFVNYHEVTSKTKNADASLALHTLMEIPQQYKTIKSLGYLKKESDV